MTTTIWNNAVSGDWIDVADWTPALPNSKRDAIINANGTYTVTVSSADVARSLTLDATGATLSEISGGSLTLGGGLTLDAGTVILNGANSFHGNTRLIGGTLELGNAAALGNSNLTIDGGALVGIANTTISNAMTASGTFTLAAGHGDVVKLESQTVLNMNSGGTINFGQAGDDGTIVWAPDTLGVAHGGIGISVDVNVSAGTLRDGNGSLNEVLSAANTVNVAVGAKLDIHGNTETISNLNGGGAIISSVNGGALIVDDGDFSGTIGGALALTVGHILTLAGVNTYTGGTTIDADSELFLQGAGSIKGGTVIGVDAALYFDGTGSIRGNIVDDGILDLHREGSAPLILNDGITGTGAVRLRGGTIILDGANTYTGGTEFYGATLKVDGASALGTGAINIFSGGGDLIGTATEAFSNQLIVSGTATFAASGGTTLTLNTGTGWTIGSNADIVFGSSGSNGVVVWDSPVGSNVDSTTAHDITIAGGTLRAGDSNFQTLLDATAYQNQFPPYQHGFVDVTHNGTLDVAGFATSFAYLRGNGTIENSGASITVAIANGNFNGVFSGPITLEITYRVSLGGEAANVGAVNIDPFAQLSLESASSTTIDFSSHQNAALIFDDPSQFTGTIVGFGQTDRMMLPTLGTTNLAVSYSGDATGGTLTLTSSTGSANITMVGDYTDGTFYFVRFKQGHTESNEVLFYPSPSAASAAHVDAFNFNAVPATHTVPEAGVTYLHRGHDVNEFAFAHNVTDAMHTHGLVFDHFSHGLFTHGHALPEALL